MIHSSGNTFALWEHRGTKREEPKGNGCGELPCWRAAGAASTPPSGCSLALCSPCGGMPWCQCPTAADRPASHFPLLLAKQITPVLPQFQGANLHFLKNGKLSTQHRLLPCILLVILGGDTRGPIPRVKGV